MVILLLFIMRRNDITMSRLRFYWLRRAAWPGVSELATSCALRVAEPEIQFNNAATAQFIILCKRYSIGYSFDTLN
jgi:hypothetical protein